MKFLFLLVVALALVSGCATVPPPATVPALRADPLRLTSYEFTGRIAVKQEEKGSYGNIRWVKRGPDTDVTLLSPLGQVVAEIRGDAAGVMLTLADRTRYQAADGEKLTEQVLGYMVPVKGLNYWLLGSAAVGAPAVQNLRPDGLLDSLKQDGWRIQYADYAPAGEVQLPRRLVLDRGNLEIRLAIDQWTLSAGGK